MTLMGRNKIYEGLCPTSGITNETRMCRVGV